MKKLISILLSISILFSFCVPFASADDTAIQETAGRSFHAQTIRNMIEVNLELDNVDEEFYHILTNAYLTDPVLLAQTIADLQADEIHYLARAISYDLQKTGRVDLAVLPEDCGSEAADAVARIIIAEANNTANASIMAFLDEEMTASLMAPAVAMANAGSLFVNVTLAPERFASTTEAVSVTVTLGTTAIVSSERVYAYEIHKVKDGEDSIAAFGRMRLDANSLGTTLTKSITFNAAGEYEVYALIRDGQETVATSTRYPMYVDGQWHITVELPSNRNYKGTLTLYDASGTQIHQCECLGRSDSGAASNIYEGNTPTGECLGTLYGPMALDDQDSYGPYKVIVLTPVSGDIKDFTNRSGIWIHGGDPCIYPSAPWYPLRPTYGCIRVSNADQLALQTHIEALIANSNHQAHGTVSIVEYEYTG